MLPAFLALGLAAGMLAAGPAKGDGAAAESGATDEVATYQRSFWGRMLARPNPDPGYRLTFRLLRDIALPGPLPDGRLRLAGGEVELNVPGGVARTGWHDGAVASIDTAAEPLPEPAAWAEDPRGRYRAQFLASGTLVVEKRCKGCRQPWKRDWRLKVPGSVLSVPLITEDRIYFGAQDNRVYCVNKKNGHRIWVADLDRRISRPLALWAGPVTVEEEDGRGAARVKQARVVLVVPDGGGALEALDARGGRSLARYELQVEEGRLLGVPLPTPDGTILVAREKYSANEASLMVLTLDAGSADDRQRPAGQDARDGDATAPAVREAGEGARRESAPGR